MCLQAPDPHGLVVETDALARAALRTAMAACHHVYRRRGCRVCWQVRQDLQVRLERWKPLSRDNGPPDDAEALSISASPAQLRAPRQRRGRVKGPAMAQRPCEYRLRPLNSGPHDGVLGTCASGPGPQSGHPLLEACASACSARARCRKISSSASTKRTRLAVEPRHLPFDRMQFRGVKRIKSLFTCMQ